MKLTALLAGVAALVCALPANAATYAWSFTDTSNGVLTGYGELETSDTPATGGGYDVTSFSGIYNSQTILGLATDGKGYFTFDNKLIGTTVAPFVDDAGILFSTATGLVNIFNLTSTKGEDFASFHTYSAGSYQDKTGYFAIRQATGAVPEAATWMMMIAGFGAVGMAMRHRRSTVAVRFG